MKKFEFPVVQVEKFSVEDVITVSNQLPTIPGGFGGGGAITPRP